jgi:hypothetical protein
MCSYFTVNGAPRSSTQVAMWGVLVASRCIFMPIMTLLFHINTATTKKNSTLEIHI